MEPKVRVELTNVLPSRSNARKGEFLMFEIRVF